MSIKTIQICIPECEQLPDIVSLFTPEENYMMIKIGSDCLREGRKVVSTLTQKEIYNKLKAETKKDVEKLELDLLVQKRMEEQQKNLHEIQLNKMKKEISDLQNEIINFKSDNSLLVKQEVEKEKERGKIMLDEKEKLIKSLTEISERLAKQNETKSSRELGDEGENAFEQLSVTFRDFQGYRIENKTRRNIFLFLLFLYKSQEQ
jgi:curved DNA-binding protein CbpA